MDSSDDDAPQRSSRRTQKKKPVPKIKSMTYTMQKIQPADYSDEVLLKDPKQSEHCECEDEMMDAKSCESSSDHESENQHKKKGHVHLQSFELITSAQ